MNMKILSTFLIIAFSMNAMARLDQRRTGPISVNPDEEEMAEYSAAYQDTQTTPAPPAPVVTGTTGTTGTTTTPPTDFTAASNAIVNANGTNAGQKCDALYALDTQMKAATPAVTPTETHKFAIDECNVFKKLSGGPIQPGSREDNKASMDGKITCKKKASYTADYDECVKAVNFYTAVTVAETAMNLQQTVRTDLKNQNIQKKAQAEMAQGQSQTSMFDAAAASNNHQKAMQQEKMIAYSAAVAALVRAHMMIPSAKKIQEQTCPGMQGDTIKANCPGIFNKNARDIAANGDAKNSLMTAIMEFTAKGVAAGIAMGQYGNAAKQIEAAKSTIQDDETDMMMDACVLNPTDPACAKTRNRVAGQSISSGDFGAGDMGGTNSFNMGSDSEVVPEMGGETNLDEAAPIAGINSPFVDDAKIAKGILDPAAAAQMQATGGASGGGGGGSGGGGGGGASLGSDLNGANKDGDKEAQIKTNKVSGAYAQGGGAGYKGVGKSKDDANPFASLFDAKGNGGGVEEDRSIASGDIDGASSGLFQKISKRYNQIQADKRIEAKNLE